MGNVTIDTTKPAPKGWRKFENAFIIFISPAISGLIMGWGLSDGTANKLMLLLGFVVSLVKATGYFLANGEEYKPVEPPVKEDKQ